MYMINYTKEEAVALSEDFLNTLLGDLPETDKEDILKVVVRATIIRMFEEWYRHELVREFMPFGEFLTSQGI
ncbi:MAG: hypothetical protein [Cryophage ML09]|nr:MAG: hypothetical protein [Cryophage ML09]